MCLKIKNYSLKIFMKIHVSDKNVLQYRKYYFKTENIWLKTQSKYTLNYVTNVKDAWARAVRSTLPLHAIINVTFSCQALFLFLFFFQRIKWNDETIVTSTCQLSVDISVDFELQYMMGKWAGLEIS